jgi:DNA-binding transcriptional LysR family regulator
MRNLDLSLLRTLLHVAHAESMTVAARRLHMTQGAVSQQVQRLEQMLGQVLLVRGKNGTRLTAHGERLLPQARQLVELNDAVFAALRAPVVSGRIRFGVPHDLMGTHLPPILQAFARQFPLVEIALVAGSSLELKTAFEAGAVDLALNEEIADLASGEPLAIERPVWIGKMGGQAWRLRPLPLSLVSATCVFRPPLIAALAEGGIAWRTMIDYPSVEATVAMVRADLAVTVLLPSTMPPDLTLLADGAGLPPLPPFAITLHTHAQSGSASAALADALRTAYAPPAHEKAPLLAPAGLEII